VDSAEINARVDTERARLLETLEGLTHDQWASPSLCSGWSIRDLVVHLLMPYEVSAPRFVAMMLRARFAFDRAADRWARADSRPPPQVIAGLRETEHRRFGVPGAGAAAPLSHLVIHAQDVYRPLGIPSPTDPDTAAVVLDELMTPRAQRALSPGLLDGLAFRATDADWRHGSGAEVSGPATALLTTLAGRSAALPDLAGDGVAQLTGRLEPARAA
jgi:uncharacterized protein (TIGR03083 family)